MKRIIAIVLIGTLLAGFALSVSADPIGVGGYEMAKSAATPFPGKGNPQGGPFQVPDVQLMSSPIGVGGYE